MGGNGATGLRVIQGERGAAAVDAAAIVWLRELARSWPGLVDAYVPGRSGLRPRDREAAIVLVAAANGSVLTERLHQAWATFLGVGEDDDLADLVLAYAEACVDLGRPASLGELRDEIPLRLLRAMRATVARAELVSLAERRSADVLRRVAGRARSSPHGFVRDAVAAAAALPVAVPLGLPVAAAGAALRLVTGIAPRLPEIEAPPVDESGLVVQLLADAVPTYLRNAFVRLVLVRMPGTLVVGVRSAEGAATVRVGAGRIVVEEGLAEDAHLVMDGVEPLLDLAAGAILREVGDLASRPFR